MFASNPLFEEPEDADDGWTDDGWAQQPDDAPSDTADEAEDPPPPEAKKVRKIQVD